MPDADTIPTITFRPPPTSLTARASRFDGNPPSTSILTIAERFMPDGSFVISGMALSVHPLAELFPTIDGEEFARLVADIKVNGLRYPIVTIGGAILDGRNRYRACKEAGIPVTALAYEGDNPRAYVLSANLHRRHLNESQRAMVAAKLETMEHGGDRRSCDANLHVDRAGYATLLHVSSRSIADAKKVRENATPALAKRVEQGDVAVSVAAKIAEMPQAQQEALADAKEAELRNAAKKSQRTKREQDLGDATRAASTALNKQLYGVIYADPPWRFEPYSRDTGLDRAADNHYPTMTLDVLKSLPIPAADDCVLFMWATAPMMPEALALMNAWGFTYKSQFIWVKDRVGTGYWNRNAHELLLIGTRGQIPAPAPGEQFCSAINADVGKHSEKPAAFAKMIKEMFPSLPALEMFARGPRLGWAVWGNEVGHPAPRASAE